MELLQFFPGAIRHTLVEALPLHLEGEHYSEKEVAEVALLSLLLLGSLLDAGFVEGLRGPVQLPGSEAPGNITFGACSRVNRRCHQT